MQGNLTIYATLNSKIVTIATKDVTESVSPFLMTLPLTHKVIFQTITFSSLTTGTLFRLLVLKVVRGQGWFNLPINMMILLEELSNMVGWTRYGHC